MHPLIAFFVACMAPVALWLTLDDDRVPCADEDDDGPVEALFVDDEAMVLEE